MRFIYSALGMCVLFAFVTFFLWLFATGAGLVAALIWRGLLLGFNAF